MMIKHDKHDCQYKLIGGLFGNMSCYRLIDSFDPTKSFKEIRGLPKPLEETKSRLVTEILV